MLTSKVIYLAGKYRGTSKCPPINWLQRQLNIYLARLAAQRLWKEGNVVICPHLNTANFDEESADFLGGYLRLLAKCDKMMLLPGWNQSEGTIKEIKVAHTLKIPVEALPDNGERVTFGEGTGMREPKDTYFHLIPMSALMALAKHYHDGSIKYGGRNWEKGVAWSTCIDAIFRHVLKYSEHGNQDENHLAAILWNAAALIEYEKTHPELNDLKWK